MPSESGAIDLSKNSTQGPELTPEQEEQLARMADEGGLTGDFEKPEDSSEEPPVVTTGFIVLMGQDGQVQVTSLTQGVNVRMVREPTRDDIYGAVSVVRKDFAAVEAAEATIGMQQAMAARIQQQMQASQTVAQLGDLRGGKRG